MVSGSPVDFTPYLDNGSNSATNMGFQGDFSVLNVTLLGGQVGTTGRIQEAVGLAASGGTVNVSAGTYTEDDISITQSVSLLANGGAVNVTAPSTGSGTGVSINAPGATITLQGFTLSGFGTGISASAADTLNLQDDIFTSNTSGGSITGVTNLNVTSTSPADQTVTVTSGPDTYQFNSENAIGFGGVTNLAFNTGDGSDTFDVQPSSTTSISINGGNPTLPTLPGDTVTLNLAGGAAGAAQTLTGPSSGYWTSSNRQTVTYSNIETTAVTGGTSSLVFDMGSGFASGGPSDNITAELDATGTLFEILVNGVLAKSIAIAALNAVQILGTSADDTLTVDASNGNPIPAGGLAFDGQGSGVRPVRTA